MRLRKKKYLLSYKKLNSKENISKKLKERQQS